jgi:hypothetical protein
MTTSQASGRPKPQPFCYFPAIRRVRFRLGRRTLSNTLLVSAGVELFLASFAQSVDADVSPAWSCPGCAALGGKLSHRWSPPQAYIKGIKGAAPSYRRRMERAERGILVAPPRNAA